MIGVWMSSLILLNLGDGGEGVGGGGSFLPTENLNLLYFWTACGMNLKLYDFS